MVSISSRGFRVINSIQHYIKMKPNHFDASLILNKIQIMSLTNKLLEGVFTVDPTMCNGGDTLHGGYICSVIDTLSVFALLATDKGRLSWTTGMNTTYLNSAKLGDKISVRTTTLRSGVNPVLEAHLENVTTGLPVAKGILSFQQGSEIYQKLTKDIMNFDVFEE